MTPEEVMQAVRELPASADPGWDGQDEDDRPATAEELQAALAAARRRRGRPAGSGTKKQVRYGWTGTCWPRSAPAVPAGRRA